VSVPPTLFLAVELPDRLCQVLLPVLQLLQEAGPELQAARPDALHITLQFLGRVEPSRLPSVLAAAEEVATGATPFQVLIEGIGTFSRPGWPAVVWAGAGVGEAELGGLAEGLGAQLRGAGWSLSRRPFRGHCTLARLRRRPSPATVAAVNAVTHRGLGQAPLLFEVDTISLLESVATAAGPNRYPARQSWRLAGG
jgi:2'-5' RNA ligase